MGLRGPLRRPDSRRGQAEIKRRQKDAQKPTKQKDTPQSPVVTTTQATSTQCIPVAVDSKLPTPPKCFTREQAETFQKLVTDLLVARVPLERVDGHALGMAVRCLSAIEGAEAIANDGDANTEQRLSAYRLMSAYSKDLKDWLQIVCAAPGARARIGLKAVPEKKAGPLAQMLAARQGRKT